MVNYLLQQFSGMVPMKDIWRLRRRVLKENKPIFRNTWSQHPRMPRLQLTLQGILAHLIPFGTYPLPVLLVQPFSERYMALKTLFWQLQSSRIIYYEVAISCYFRPSKRRLNYFLVKVGILPQEK